MKTVAIISFDKGSPYKKYEMNIFPNTTITIKEIVEGASTLFEGDIKELIQLLWNFKHE